jgi:hypothetical protein
MAEGIRVVPTLWQPRSDRTGRAYTTVTYECDLPELARSAPWCGDGGVVRAVLTDDFLCASKCLRGVRSDGALHGAVAFDAVGGAGGRACGYPAVLVLGGCRTALLLRAGSMTALPDSVAAALFLGRAGVPRRGARDQGPCEKIYHGSEEDLRERVQALCAPRRYVGLGCAEWQFRTLASVVAGERADELSRGRLGLEPRDVETDPATDWSAAEPDPAQLRRVVLRAFRTAALTALARGAPSPVAQAGRCAVGIRAPPARSSVAAAPAEALPLQRRGPSPLTQRQPQPPRPQSPKSLRTRGPEREPCGCGRSTWCDICKCSVPAFSVSEHLASLTHFSNTDRLVAEAVAALTFVDEEGEPR